MILGNRRRCPSCWKPTAHRLGSRHARRPTLKTKPVFPRAQVHRGADAAIADDLDEGAAQAPIGFI